MMHVSSSSVETSVSPSKITKVMIFSGFYLPFLGGIERYTEKLSNELTKMGYSVVIVTTNHAALSPIVKGEIVIYRLPTFKLFKNRYPIPKLNKEYRYLMKKIEQEQGDVIICNTRFQLTTLLGLRFAKIQAMKALVIEHGSSHFSIGVRLLDTFGGMYEHALTKIIKHYNAKYYGVSNACNHWLGHFGIVAEGVFYNSVDSVGAKRFQEVNKYRKKFLDKIVIVYAGRIIREKGVEMLVEAYKDVSITHNAILVIAGDGQLLNELQRANDNNPQIIFEGKLAYDDLMQLLDVADIFCYPSMYPEGLPTAILEAGIMKTAIVATDRGGTSEVITSDDYGIIVSENKESLANTLRDLLRDPKRVKLLKNNIYRRVMTNFTWEITAAKVDAALKEALRNDEKN